MVFEQLSKHEFIPKKIGKFPIVHSFLHVVCFCHILFNFSFCIHSCFEVTSHLSGPHIYLHVAFNDFLCRNFCLLAICWQHCQRLLYNQVMPIIDEWWISACLVAGYDDYKFYYANNVELTANWSQL